MIIYWIPKGWELFLYNKNMVELYHKYEFSKYWLVHVRHESEIK